MKPLTYGSLFSGTECMSAAAIGLPLVPRFFAEVEPYPCAILRSKFPDVPNLGDVTKIKYDSEMKTLSNGHDSVDLSQGLDILAGGSPCFVAGTLVLTPSGYRPIEDLKVGDEVVGGKTGEIRRVEAVGSKVAPVGRIKVLGRSPITCTHDHKFSCVKMRRDCCRTSWTYNCLMPEGDYAYVRADETVGLYAGRVKNIFPFVHHEIPTVYSCSHNDMMALAGYYLGDGYIRHFTATKKSVFLALVSPRKIAEFKSRFGGKANFSVGKDGKVVICCSALALWLIDNFGEGATEKRVPYWVYSDTGRDALLGGYLATDGCVQGRNRKFLTVSRKLALGIADLIGHASVSKQAVPPTCEIEGRTVRQHDTYTIQWPHIPVRTKYVNGRYASKVRSYEDAGTAARVFNITVSDEHAYIVEGLWVKNCQDFSTAGLRAGARSETLDDGGTTRSSLIYTYVRLVREIRPRWIVYENVPGMLTSNEGRDFAHFLVALAQCGYGDFAWRVLDAQYVRVDGMERAVPQRRRRVWLVGRLGANDGRSAEVLLEPYGDPGDIPPRRKTGEEVARSLAARAGVHGGVVGGAGRGGVSAFNFELWANPPSGLIDAVCARRAHDWMLSFRSGSFAQFVPDAVSGTLDCDHMTRAANGTPCLAVGPASFDPFEPGGLKSVRTDGASQTVVNGTCPGSHNAVVTNSNGGDVAPTLAVADLVKQYTGQADRGGGYVCATIEHHKCGDERVRETAVAPTMGASRNANASNDNPLVVERFCIGFKTNPSERARSIGAEEEVAPCLSSMTADAAVAVPERPAPFVKTRHAKSADDDEKWVGGEVVGTRNVHDGERPQEVVVERPAPDAVCIAENVIGRGDSSGGNGVGAQSGVAYTLDTVAPHAVCYDGYNQSASEEVCMTIRSAATGAEGNDADPKVCVSRSYGMNPQNGSQMFPCTEEVDQTLAVQHQGGVVAPTRSTCLTPGDPLTKRVYTADGAAPTLMAIAKDSGISAQAFALPQTDAALPEVVVRRLTPTECERLMGLPDGWTRVTFTKEQIADPDIIAYFRRVHDDWQKMNAGDGKTPKPKTEAFVRDWLARISDPATCPDAPRYKVCGNGWATNCPRWILLNLLRAEGIDPWYLEETK